MTKRFISALLVVCMLFSAIPIEMFAVENSEIINTKIINPFLDINEHDWFYDDVLYAYKNNLFGGTSEHKFSPKDAMTRGMFVTVIGRMVDIDINKYKSVSTFIDVNKNEYYAPYIEWAKQIGITSGTGNGEFSPNELITRQDMATFIVRFFDACGYTYPKASDKTVPKDIAMISPYAMDAVLKLWSVGLFKGDINGNFNPLKSATRSETATLCSRIHRNENAINDDSLSERKKYEIEFESNGGSNIGSQYMRSGTLMNDLPIPFKENHIFEGWCYDKELTLPTSTIDTVEKDMTLYAKYLETAPLKEAETPHFASSLDQSKDFIIKVISSKEMTSDNVKKAILAKNLSSITQEDFITVTGSGKSFLISGTNGFEEGATFKFSLTDDDLSFEGFPSSVRDYNLTIAKDKTLNFSLNSDIIYIPASEITKITGKANSPIRLNENNVAEAEASGGTFEYSGDIEIKVGDNLAIYEGVRPDLRTVDNDNDGDILYIKINEKSGNSYKYGDVKTEDVLFTPDVLPISISADTDGNTNNQLVTIPKETLDFSGDIYQNIGLDSQTTIDKGDFISFYDGDFGQNMQITNYAKIIDIITNDDSYIIEFDKVTEQEMFVSMDAYDTNQISGKEMLENVDKDKIEKSVEQQALNSGFAEESALYLASLALKTDSFSELSDVYNLKDIQIKTKDGEDISDGQIMLMDGQKVEVDISKLQATLGTNLEYFDDYDGLRLTLEIGVEIKIHVSDKADIVIEITGKFEQEVRIDINVDGGAVWKWWGPFPYISEYEATANIDLFNYTGIGIEATIVTSEAEEDDLTGSKDKTINDIGKQLKELMDAKDKYIGDGSGTVADGLADKYKAMIENEDSEWVELFSKDIFKKEFNICLIIAVEVSVEFLVTANVNISLGMDFYYANAKRYTYTIAVFAESVTSDVIDILEEQYQFEFYVMGTLGLRAGIKAEIKVGLFTTKLASVGFSAEVGAYVRVWGYFYYQLRWTASEGKTTKSCGAMLFELGIYLEIKFEAQAFNGTFSYNPTLYENEWPLWYAGMRENVQDFAYELKEAPEFDMKRTIQSTDVPDELFEMEYMDLKTGETETKIFDDSKNFKIKMSNEAFSYNPQTNRISVVPGKSNVQEGQMIVTWITAPLAFTSAPIERRVTLYWDNYNDGYSIAFNSNGGSVVPIIIQRFGGSIKAPESPVKQGYIFGGWYTDQDLKNEYKIPSVMPDKDCSVYAKWIPATDTKYEVFHYTQDLNGNYTLVDKDTLSGVTDSIVTPETKKYIGFISPALQTITIKPDGSAKVNYYYKRNTYTATFAPGDALGDNVISKFKYGATVTAPTFSKEGYEFIGWNTPVATLMPAEDVTYTALWTPENDTNYRVEHYVMQTNGQYKLKEFENKTSSTDFNILVSGLKKPDIEVENGIAYSYATVKGQTVDSASVKADGTLVIKLYYDRIKYSITFKSGNGENDITNILNYEESITLPKVPVHKGYAFAGWFTDEACTAILDNNMPAKNVTAYAKWIPNTNTPYTVEHYVMGTDGNYSLIPTHTDNLTGITDKVFTLSDLLKSEMLIRNGIEYSHAEVNNITATQATISGDGSLVIKLFYERKVYNITWEIGNSTTIGDYTANGNIYYGASIIPPMLLRDGYTYVWDKIISTTMPAQDCTYKAIWTANTNTPFTVEHYQQNVDNDNYTLKDRDSFVGITDTTAYAQSKEYDYFTLNPNANDYLEHGNINGDGSLILKLYYDRDIFTVTFDAGDGTLSSDATKTLKHGSIVYTSNPTRQGYGFGGWYTDESFADDKRFNGIMPNDNITVYAKWIAGQVTYGIEHYVMDIGGNYSDNAYLSEIRTSVADNYVVLSELKNNSLEVINGIEYKESKIGNEVTTAAAITADGSLIVKMYYERKQYELFWNLDGGLAENHFTEGSIFYGSPITAPLNLRKTGYTYTWDNTLISTMPSTNVNYKALWTVNKYSVIFNANDGTDNTKVQNFNYNEEKLLTENSFERTGYTFVGWANKPNDKKLFDDCASVKNLTAIQNDTVYLYAVWKPINYNISFNTLYGSIENTTYTVEYAANLPVISHTGYTFDGWYDNPEFNGTAIKQISTGTIGDKVFYAKWKENKYTILFNANGGTGVMEAQEFTYTEEKELSANSFIRPSYTFVGWATSAKGTKVYDNSQMVKSLIASVNENVTLYAVWAPITYNISYILNGGSNNTNPTQYDVTSGTITLEAPSRTGYTFNGWYIDEALNIKATDPAIKEGETGDKIFYAKWTANTYTVSFNSNGGSGTMAPQYFTYDSAVKSLTENNFTLSGYNFSGWNTKFDGSGVSYTDKEEIRNLLTTPNGNINLYAKWTPIQYLISYNVYGGTNSLQNPASYNIETSTISFANPVHSTEGNVFAGWYTDSGFNNVITEIPTGSTGNITLYAKWINCGKFTISNNGNNTFTVLRSGGKDSAQTVYYRTLNGSAIGGTHFTHQENSVTFADGQMSATFTISESGSNTMFSNNAATAFVMANREYYVELYNVSGGATLGSTTKVKRTMLNDNNFVISEANMTDYKKIASVTKSGGGKNGLQIYENSGGGYAGTANIGLNSNSLNTSAYGNLSNYISATVDGMRVQLRNFKGTDDGWRMYRYVLFNTSPNDVSFSSSKNGSISNLPNGTKVALVYGINTDTNNTDIYSVNLPNTKGAIISATGTNKTVSINDASWASGQPSNDYVLYGLNESIGISIGGYNSASANSSWWFNSADLYTMPYDISAPDYLGTAPMSNTSYKLGSKVTIALVFDEIIKSADGVTILTNLSSNAFTLVGGLGTNVLYFEGTVTSTATSASVTTINNRINIKDIFNNAKATQ